MSIIQNILYVSGELVMMFVMIYCISKISKTKVNINLKKILLLVIFSQLMIISNMYNYVSLRIPFSIIISTIVNKIIFKLKIKDSLKYTLVYIITLTIIEYLLTFLLLKLKIHEIQIFNNSIIIKWFFSILEGISIILFFSNKRVTVYINKLGIALKSNLNIFNILLLIISLLNIFMIYKVFNMDNKYIALLSTICIVFIIFTLIIIINDKYNINKLKIRNQNLQDAYRAYAQTIEEYRIIKHNLRNELYSIKSKVAKKYQNEINNIIIKNNKDFDWISQLNDIPEGLQGVMFLKKNEAERRKIKIYINTNNFIDVKDNDYIDLCDAVSICIDNAIEATNKMKKKVIAVDIYESKKEIKIEIINKFKNKININKLGRKNYSTKEIKSGLGLNYINNLKNKHIKTKYKIIDNLFISEIKYTK